jgi:hypothetical protein
VSLKRDALSDLNYRELLFVLKMGNRVVARMGSCVYSPNYGNQFNGFAYLGNI